MIMKKSMYISILTIITVLCMVIGIASNVAGCSAFGGERGRRMTGTESLEAFEVVEIETSIMDVEIQAGDEYKIYYDAIKRVLPVYEVADGVLKISQKEERGKGWFNGIGEGSEMVLVITVPQDAILTSMEIISDVGNVDIQNVAFEKGVIETDVGDVSTENCHFTDLEIISDVGDVEIKTVGDVKEYTMELSTDVGEVDVEDIERGNDFIQNGTSDKKIVVIGDVGDIEVE